MTVFVRGKINKNNEWVDEQLLYRAPPELVHAERLALRDPLHVRQGRASLLHALASAAP